MIAIKHLQRLILALLVVLPLCCWSQDQPVDTVLQRDKIEQPVDTVRQRNKIQQLRDRVKQRIEDKLNEPYDTIRDKGYWFRAMKHGKVDFNDESMGYPRFVKFCYRAYKWGDRAFNSYDTSYVVSTGKNWKLMLKNNNWADTYHGFPTEGSSFDMVSKMTCNLGVQLSFMAVSVGYTMAITNLIHGKDLSKKVDFSFTCARFAADAYYMENRSNTTLHYRLPDSDKRHKYKEFSGLNRKQYGMSAYYFFNNRHYAQAAAYCFSKYQKRSAGSLIAGFSIQHHDLTVDVNELSDDVRAELTEAELSQMPRYRYNDYCLLVGYGYNWAIKPKKWLLNVTVAPYLGYRHLLTEIVGDKASAFSMNCRLRAGLVYNHKKMFAGLQNNVELHHFKSVHQNFTSSLIDFTALVGIRF